MTHHHYYQPPPVSGYAVTALILGLLGFGIFAVIFGGLGLAETNRGQKSGGGMAVAGLVLGIITSILWLLILPGMIAIYR